MDYASALALTAAGLDQYCVTSARRVALITEVSEMVGIQAVIVVLVRP